MLHKINGQMAALTKIFDLKTIKELLCRFYFKLT